MARLYSPRDRLSNGTLERLRAAADALGDVLVAASPASEWTTRPPRSGDFGWVIHRHGCLFAEEFAWDDRFEARVAGAVADVVQRRDWHRQRAWIVELDGVQVGSVFCSKVDEHTAELKLLLVEPSARGLGIGSQLAAECVAFATTAGYRELIAWTTDLFMSAERLLSGLGFAVDEEKLGGPFGDLTPSRRWRLDLPHR